MSILAKFVEYSKNPTIETDYVIKNKVWEILKLISFLSVVSLFCSVIGDFVISYTLYDINSNLLNKIISNELTWMVFLGFCLEAPFSEELQFRLLLKPTFRNLLVSLWLGLSGFLYISILNSVGWNTLLGPIFTFLTLLIILYRIFSSNKRNQNSVVPQKYYKYLYYFSIFYFAFVHFNNYADNSIWFLLPILVLPQFIAGFSYSFIRMHFGIGWSILTHALENFVVIFPILICKEAASSIYESIKNSKQIIPDLVYTLPQNNQILYFFGVGVGSAFLLFGLFMSVLGIKKYLQYKKSQSYVQ